VIYALSIQIEVIISQLISKNLISISKGLFGVLKMKLINFNDLFASIARQYTTTTTKTERKLILFVINFKVRI